MNERTIRAIFQNTAEPFLQKNFFGKLLSIDVTVWLMQIRTYKNADEKEHTFSRRSKNVKQRTINGYCVNPPLCAVSKFCNYV